MAQQRLFEAEADVEVTHWEKRQSDISLYGINQEFESQRLQLQQANHWADQAQRDSGLPHDGILWSFKKTFLNDHLLKKDDPTHSSTIQRIPHHLLED